MKTRPRSGEAKKLNSRRTLDRPNTLSAALLGRPAMASQVQTDGRRTSKNDTGAAGGSAGPMGDIVVNVKRRSTCARRWNAPLVEAEAEDTANPYQTFEEEPELNPEYASGGLNSDHQEDEVLRVLGKQGEGRTTEELAMLQKQLADV
eukprot:2933165-Prymnesium_polylepis.1